MKENKNKRRKITKIERKIIYDKMHGHCAYCGCELKYEDMQVDHVVPLRNGGEDLVRNMLPSCRSCNHFKDTQDIETFRKSIESWPEVLMRDSVTYKNAIRYGLVKPNPGPVVFYFEKLEVER